MRSSPHLQAITITTLCYHGDTKQLYCARSNKGSCCDVIVIDVEKNEMFGSRDDNFGDVIGRFNGCVGYEDCSRYVFIVKKYFDQCMVVLSP